MFDEFKIKKFDKPGFETPLDCVSYVSDDTGMFFNPTIEKGSKVDSQLMELAGPRRKIYFRPSKSKAAIVTCGGLCPGLNDVIRGLTMVLWYRYGVKDILGIRYGYQGLTFDAPEKPIILTPEEVEDINNDGGTILGSSRGHQDVGEMVDFLEKNNINILFTIGGDGTQRGSLVISEEIEKRKLDISVIGIPKTIDNDIAYTERTFGFETAIEMSRAPIYAAHMEARGAINGIGLVKLMGRECGFIGAYATLATSDVNLLLVPEVKFSMEKLFEYLDDRLYRKSHALIVVAEGAGQDLVPVEGVNKSGNKIFGDIGIFLKKEINNFLSKKDIPHTIKYIDPSYTIRSAPANADDSVFCFQLAENAVHAAMTGRTAMVVGIWNNRFVHVPVQKAVEFRKKVDPEGLIWQSILDNTGQPRALI